MSEKCYYCGGPINGASMLSCASDLKERLAAAEALLDSRAGKLLRNGKTFIVVAVDEPYFSFVYDLIRKQEKHKGRWTDECEAAFQAANKEVNAIFAAKAGGCDASVD